MTATDLPSIGETDTSSDAPPTTDGRQLRRLRNIEAVRAAILELQLERATIDLDTVAARAGVTVRSIYRYHADLDAAIADAYESRLAEVYALWERWERPRADASLDERIDALLGHRMAMEELGRPLRNTVQAVDPDPDFDRETSEVFAPELASIPDEERERVARAVHFLLRPRGLRSMLEAPSHVEQDQKEMIAFMIRRMLTGG